MKYLTNFHSLISVEERRNCAIKYLSAVVKHDISESKDLLSIVKHPSKNEWAIRLLESQVELILDSELKSIQSTEAMRGSGWSV